MLQLVHTVLGLPRWEKSACKYGHIDENMFVSGYMLHFKVIKNFDRNNFNLFVPFFWFCPIKKVK